MAVHVGQSIRVTRSIHGQSVRSRVEFFFFFFPFFSLSFLLLGQALQGRHASASQAQCAALWSLLMHKLGPISQSSVSVAGKDLLSCVCFWCMYAAHLANELGGWDQHPGQIPRVGKDSKKQENGICWATTKEHLNLDAKSPSCLSTGFLLSSPLYSLANSDMTADRQSRGRQPLLRAHRLVNFD